jgi:hypothetical protein
MNGNRRVLLTLVAASIVLARMLLLLNTYSQPVWAAGTLCVNSSGSGCGLCGGGSFCRSS